MGKKKEFKEIDPITDCLIIFGTLLIGVSLLGLIAKFGNQILWGG